MEIIGNALFIPRAGGLAHPVNHPDRVAQVLAVEPVDYGLVCDVRYLPEGAKHRGVPADRLYGVTQGQHVYEVGLMMPVIRRPEVAGVVAGAVGLVYWLSYNDVSAADVYARRVSHDLLPLGTWVPIAGVLGSPAESARPVAQVAQ